MMLASQVQLLEARIKSKVFSGMRVKFVWLELYEQWVEGSTYNPGPAGYVYGEQAISPAVLSPLRLDQAIP